MDPRKRNLVVAAVALGAAACAFVFLNRQGDEAPTEVKGAIYYTGPIKSKGGDVWGTPDGKVAERPTNSPGTQAGASDTKPADEGTKEPANQPE